MRKNTLNRIRSVFIAMVMMITIIPVDVLAIGKESVTEEKQSTLLHTENILLEENSEDDPEITVIDNQETSVIDESTNEVDESAVEEIVEPAVYSIRTIDSLDRLVTLADKTSEASVSVSDKKITVDAGGLILLSNISLDLSDYTILFSTLSGGYADLTKTITIKETSTDENGIETASTTDYSFVGLGSESNPFSGTIESQDGKYGAILNVPFFKNVDTSKVTFSNLSVLRLKQKGDSTTAMLAANVSGTSGEAWKSLDIEVGKESVVDGGTTTDYLPTALIDTMSQNASLSLGTITYTDGAAVSAANAGLLCNTMNESSSLEVNTLSVNGTVSITATSGDAGGLVGVMNNGSGLLVNSGADTAFATIGSAFTITGQNAGGLVGKGDNVKLSVKSTIDGATVKGSNSAGGLIGNYTTGEVDGGFTTYDGSESSMFKVNNVALETTAIDKYAGGIFGVLDLKADFSISNASVTSTISGSKAYYGGLVGQLKGDSAVSLRALTINGTSNPITGTSVNLNGYAGAVAVVGDTSSPVYVKIEGEFSPYFNGANLLIKGTYFGGVAAYLKSDSVLELTANVTIAYDKIAEKNGYGGGVLGNAERGSTLCLGGTTDLSGTKFKETYINEYTGQIVGKQESALIYAKSDWKLIRQTALQELDDIGTYGTVIRLGGNMGMGLSGLSGLSADLISQNATTHKTEFLDSAKNALSGNTFTITSADQLALIAIEEQTKCAFQIYGTGEDYYLSSSQNITLSDNISLEHTGIIGLQRDNDACTEYSGTLDGQNHTLTIVAGEIYGFRSNANTLATDTTAGSGQIHGHTQVGFFSHANGTMKNLTVGGSMNLRFRTKTTDTSTTYLAGGLVAKNTGSSTYTNVTTFVNIQYQGGADGSIGGLVGYGSALSFMNCTGNATIIARSSSVYAGGLIGQYSGATLSVSGTTLKGSLTATGANHARLGGLVSRIAKGSYDVVNVILSDITVNGQTITGTGIKGSNVNNVSVSASCGGLLGYEWNNASVTLGSKDSHSNGITVTGSSSVTVDGTTETAGLVYAATGYWQVNDIKLEKLSVTSGSGDLGLLICRGWRRDIPTSAGTITKPYLLYLEETSNNAYQIGTVSIISNTGGYFDEWVVYTCEKTETIANNGNSVISIATTDGTLVEDQRSGIDPCGDNCTGYQNRSEYGKTASANPNSRYYYDLDVIREYAEKNTDNIINTSGELVLWSAWRYAEEKTTVTNGIYNGKSNIQDYLKKGDSEKSELNGNNTAIDLTGYAYYPITVNGFNLIIQNIKVKFANKIIETAESSEGTSLDSLNRTTVGTSNNHTQHYLLHSGLLLNYQNSTGTEDKTLSVSNVTFQGTIGKGPNGGSGALICSQLGGDTHSTSPKYAKLNIQSVKLEGISVNADKTDDGYAPLLVNRIGNFSSLSAQNVTTSDYDGVTSDNNPAATSLIGDVGSDTAVNITLAFTTGIDLSGRKGDSIFSHATLLESFQYQSGSSGYYHFNKNEKCTYGYEITKSVEYPDLQTKYFDQSETVKDGDVDDFTDYLPYVCNKHKENTDKCHELEVNVASPDLIEGCGTYDDPYIISAPRQLMRAADFVNGNSPQTGWKVNKVDDASSIKNGVTIDTDNHTAFEVGDTNWNDEQMRTYMRSAYYKIQENLTLHSFSGFGSVDNPFIGVIDGKNSSNDGNYSIEIKNAGSGFINVSYGSVVQNLTIQYTGSKTLTDKRPTGLTGDNSKEVYEDSYFGGIIGTVLGGDSIIDNVTVAFADGFTINTRYALQCAGGFVGLIQGGGVVFRNMGTTTENPGYTGASITYYIDKYIGRVLDGYAINEVSGSGTDASVTFGGKNYTIPDISSGIIITRNDGKISIGNAQQMIILSNIINSGSASGGSAIAYSTGSKTRNADYSKIGHISNVADTEFVTARKDDTTIGADNYPYLIKKYAGNDSYYWNTCKDGTDISISFTSSTIDLSPYCNGYRGIGGRYHCNANGGTLTNNTPKIKTVTGNNVSIHVVNDIAEYRADNFYANTVGGLFNVLIHGETTIENINVYGNVTVQSGFGEETDVEVDYLKRAPVGGIIGKDYSTNESLLSLQMVSFGDGDTESTVYGECVTGGLIGSSGSKKSYVFTNASSNQTKLSMVNCSYQNVTITGGICTGGFVGSTVWNSDDYALFGESNRPSYSMIIRWEDSQIKAGKNATISNLFCATGGSTADGVGGIIGFSSIPFNVQGANSGMTSFANIELYGGKKNMRGRIGGLIGFIVNNVNTGQSRVISSIELKNMTVGATTTRNSAAYDDNAGVILGTWYASGNISISDCAIDLSSVQANSSGGVVGWAGSSGNIITKNIQISNTTFPKRGGANIGAVGGQISISFYGFNILLKDISFDNTTLAGRFFGTGTNARLIGVTVQQSDISKLPQRELYNKSYPNDYGGTNYFVYAGYNSREFITTASDIAIKPSQSVIGISDLHGDSVEPNTILSAKDDTALYRNTGATDKITEVIRSTYNTQHDNDIESDFPVVLIDGDASVLKQYLNVATNGGFDSLRKYQTTNTSGGKMEVTIDRYLYDKNSKTFSKANSSAYPATLVYHSETGEFTTTAQYDNQKDTFTLVTVKMTGYSSSYPFILHIPVIVRRMLQVDFMATMTSGTVFNKTDGFYSETKNHALASKSENITGYLTFHYNSNASDTRNPASYDWQSYMEGGGDLLGYYKKTVDTGLAELPSDTKITLIDCQNGDRRYFATVPADTTSELELFNGGKLSFTATDTVTDDTEFTPSSLSELLEVASYDVTEEQKTDTTVVKWVQTDRESATVKAKDGNYYRLYDAKNDSDITALYTLKVCNSSPKENYFVVISVPKRENHRLTLTEPKQNMVWSNETSSPPLEIHQVHRYDPKSIDPKDANSEASFNYLDNYVQSLADKYDEGTVQVQKSSAKVQIPISLSNTVTFTAENYNDKDPLYQELVISLKKTENQVSSTVGITSDAVAVTNTTNGTDTENAVKLYAYYVDELGQKQYYTLNDNGGLVKSGTDKVVATSYAWEADSKTSEMMLPFATKTGTEYQYIDLVTLREESKGKFFLETETILEMSVASVMANNTIPYDPANGEITNYTQIDAISVLSFTTSGLSYSTLKGNKPGNKHYYLNTERRAILKLDYTDIDQLGINLLDQSAEQAAEIDTVLTLDFSAMEGFVSDVKQFNTLSQADTVAFTLSLKKKGDDGYENITMTDYLKDVITSDGNQLSGTESKTIVLHKNEDGSYPYYTEQTGQFSIPLSFIVDTSVKEFANYRISARVSISNNGVNQTPDINDTNASITYTYAKINVNGYWPQSSSSQPVTP